MAVARTVPHSVRRYSQVRSVPLSQVSSHSLAGVSALTCSVNATTKQVQRTGPVVRIDDSVECHASNAVGEHIDEYRTEYRAVRCFENVSSNFAGWASQGRTSEVIAAAKSAIITY